MNKHSFQTILFGFFILLSGLQIQAQTISDAQIDSLVENVIKTYNVPGIAVAVVKDGKVIHSKGYGKRSINKGGKVDENTLFGVASNTKAFTAAAIGQLVDAGKVEWDTKVTDIIPEFKLYNPYVTSEFTVRDLLTHRSGLGLGAGDMMVFPSTNVLTKDEMINNLRYLKPVSSFRSKFDYDNLLYIVAGEVVERVSGMKYEDYVKKNFLDPLKMDRTAMSWHRIDNYDNVVEGHAPVGDHLETVGLSFTKVANSAAGIYSSVNDMSKWIIAQLHDGKYADGKELFSKKVHDEMWTPQTLLSSGKGAYNTHFSAYGLGWFLSDVNGKLQVTHTGGLLGLVSQVTMIPEMDLGIVVLTNQQSGAAFRSITNTILDSYFGITGEDRIKQYNDARLKSEKEADEFVATVLNDVKKAQNTSNVKVNLETYTGTYNDPWFGDVVISEKNGKLRFVSKNISDFTGEMSFYKGNTFMITWDDRTLNADAFATFSLNTEGKASEMKMSPVSPLTDFSYDYQDLDFTRKNNNQTK